MSQRCLRETVDAARASQDGYPRGVSMFRKSFLNFDCIFATSEMMICKELIQGNPLHGRLKLKSESPFFNTE